MCLRVAPEHHTVSGGKYNAKYRPRVAGYDILVYKVLRTRPYSSQTGTRYLSPYRDYEWKFGILTKTERDWPMRTKAEYTDRSIHAGLHAMVTKRRARTLKENNWCSSNHVIVPAIIPKGTKFWYGNKGDIAAAAMILYKDLREAKKGRVQVKADKRKHKLAL